MPKYVHCQQFSANSGGRDFVLADLHGCYKALKRAMKAVDFDKKTDRVFSVGDLIDRGKDSLACIELLQKSWFFAVQGNHENMMLASLRAGEGSDSWLGWMSNGGKWYSDLSKKELKTIKELLPLIASLPITSVIHTQWGERVGISHAQPPIMNWTRLINDKRLSGDEIWKAMWSREIIRYRKNTQVKGVDKTFHGHTIVKTPQQIGNMNFIDTGAYLYDDVSFIELKK